MTEEPTSYGEPTLARDRNFIFDLLLRECQRGSTIDLDNLAPEPKEALNEMLTDYLRLAVAIGSVCVMIEDDAEVIAKCQADPAYRRWRPRRRRASGGE